MTLKILGILQDLPNFRTILYRDDGLGITSASARQQEKLSQSIRKIFADQDLAITIEINQTRVHYLDVNLDLETGLYKPFRKPGDKPLYVSAFSNHPPQILKNIPAGIERRLSDNSANQAVFNEAIPVFQAELDRCSYKHQLQYRPRPVDSNKKKKNRKKTHYLVQPTVQYECGNKRWQRFP